MRRMNSMLLGHHGASWRTPLHVLLDREPRRRIVPRQRQVHDARRHLDLVQIAAAPVRLAQRLEQVVASGSTRGS